MFLDEAIITVQGGHGGRGCVSWRREKYVPKGGPDGGNGGRGGDVMLRADANTDTLSAFVSTKRFAAQKGLFGRGKKKNGKDGADRELRVPPGTSIIDVSSGKEELLGDLRHDGERMLIARGGRGGFGNAHFTSSVRQRPDFAELGEPGEERTIKLSLSLVADVGIIGYPSVGKSTLISVVSSAKPKIADYPFTTLIPHLGVATVAGRSFILCDLPGLIEGASEGKGLGDRFLRHSERCTLLLHLLDVGRALDAPEKLADDYRAIRKELELYSPTLAGKHELVVLNKSDLAGYDTSAFEDDLKQKGIVVDASISAATGNGTDALMKKLLPLVLGGRAKTRQSEQMETSELPILQPHLSPERMGAYSIEKRSDGSLRVSGKRLEQFTKMTDFSREGGVRRFRDVLERIGLKKALLHERKNADTPLYIGEIRVDGYL